MSDIPDLALSGVAGIALGAFFFGGLWWTIQLAVLSQRPAMLFLGSLLLRMSVALAGFYFVSHGDWQRLLVCLLGFVVARLVAVRMTRPAAEPERSRAREARHAP
ncbi:MAG: ATP synthase subunit I [Halioglobus sp.]